MESGAKIYNLFFYTSMWYNKKGDIMQDILSKCRFIFDILENSGFECYAVGGCVRDMLLGVKPHDIDFTTNATPDEILECFKNFKTFELGKKYGTISVLKDYEIYEITTYRIDGKYTDSRHPDKVEFSRNIRDDLSRRDFTVNAMAMDKNGNVLDIFGGKEDLYNKIIRAVGNAEVRFTEDALRIFRALRFSARLGFNIEKETANACKDLSNLLKNVHPQRLRDELSLFLTADTAPDILIEYRQIFSTIIPELESSFDFQQITVHHRYDVYTHTIKALSYAPKDLEIRLALLFHDIGKPLCHTVDKAGISHFNGHPKKSADIATEILKRFSFSNEFVNKVRLLIKYHDKRFERPRPHIKKVLSKLASEDFSKLLTIQRCDVMAQSEYLKSEKLAHIDFIEKEFKAILEEEACFKLSDLAVNGKDIVEIGASGKQIGDVLNILLNEVIEENISNDKETLLCFAKECISQIDK